MNYPALAGALLVAGALVTHAQQPAAPKPDQNTEAAAGPAYTAAGELIYPADFREWTFVTAGLGMTYNQPAAQPTGAPRPPNFTNVWVNPPAYRAFMQTGQWPDKTMFILEIRASSSAGSINRGGHFQSNLVVVEASVKEGGKWSFFDFGRDMKPQVRALPSTERCYACHAENGAVDNTFVQFYPTLLEVAQKMGTVRPASSKPAAGH
jgi:hypothetical protein